MGAMAISAIVCFGVLIVGLAVGVIATSPDIPVVRLLLILAAVAVVLPIVVYPVSYTVWQAVDLAMRPPDAGDPKTPKPVL